MKACLLIVFSTLLVLLGGCAKKDQSTLRLQGKTMGTSWHVTIANSRVPNKQALNELIKKELVSLNQQFSTYIPDSEISLFNSVNNTQPFSVSKGMLEVVEKAQKLSDKTQGAYDCTVAPLVNLWGFGKDLNLEKPSDQEIAELLPSIGYQHLKTIANPPKIIKNIPSLQIDLSSIAKGFSVDKIADLLDKQAVENYLVEIGGEVKVKGINPSGRKWQIAIEKPDSKAQVAQQIIVLDNMAVATSGDYRNYYEKNGVRYSHTINPKTGKPISHRLASVTVLHPSAAMADGLATAIMVLGEEKGLALAKQEELQVYMMVRNFSGAKGFSGAKDFSGAKGFHTVSTLKPASVRQ